MCCKGHKCFVILEVTTAGTSNALPESNRIRQSRITSLMVPRAGGATLYSPTGAVLATDAVVQSSYLSLVNENGTELQKIPLAHLQRDYNGPEPLHVNLKDIDPTQSRIVIGSLSASGYSATASILITFGLDCDNCGVPE